MTLSHKNLDTQIAKEQFARIKPIVGDVLFDKRVTLISADDHLLELLACCGINRFDLINSENIAADSILSLSQRLNFPITAQRYQVDEYCEKLSVQPPAIIISSGDRGDYQNCLRLADAAKCPAIFYRLLANGCGLLVLILPNDDVGQRPILPDEIFADSDDSLLRKYHLIELVANYAKGLLLKSSAYARVDIERLIDAGQRIFLAGHASWPWVIKPLKNDQLELLIKPILPALSLAREQLINKKCLIIGLGSLGSVIAEKLNLMVANLLLIDGEEVAAANPIRQIYSFEQLGEAKARACILRLAANRNGRWQESISGKQWHWYSNDNENLQQLSGYQLAIESENDLAQLDQLISEQAPEVAVIATGTSSDRAISQLLRNRAIPHVVVSCYARARYFEALVVTPTGPCFGCVRGHLYLGATPSLTPEQRARYVSNAQDLAAEPATRIETERAADLATHLAYGLLQPEQTPWLTRALADEQTFFLGGNSAEQIDVDNWAYGIEMPGTVKLFGLEDISGRGDYLECWDCGRQLPVAIKYSQ